MNPTPETPDRAGVSSRPPAWSGRRGRLRWPRVRRRYAIFLAQNGVKVYSDATIKEIGDGEAIVRYYDGVKFPVKADTIVYAERVSNNALKEACQENGIEFRLIGDAATPRGVSGAVHDGYKTGLRI